MLRLIAQITLYLDIQVGKLIQRLQGLQGWQLIEQELNKYDCYNFSISHYLFELVIVDGEELEAGAVLQHLQPLAQPVLTDVQLGEARQLGEQLDICEARVFQVQLLQFDKLVGQALRLKIHQILC